MIKFDILNRWTGAVKFTAEIDADENTPRSVKIKLAVRWKIKHGLAANLTDADLTDADLTRADLTDADLTRANLTRANLTDADLTRADLTDANLTRANLTRANLTRANLTRANLTDANLTVIRDDIWAVLSSNPGEVKTLLETIRAGRIDGSTYNGECKCLSGTLQAATAQTGNQFDPSCRNASRAAERFFLAIRIGDTPDNSQFAKLAADWISQWLAKMEAAFSTKQ